MEETKDINEGAAEEVKTAEKKKKSAKQSEIDALKAEIETLKTEAKEKDDKYLRLAAEYDNFRRRSREEKDATYSSAMADTVAELLPIIDNLERATAFDDGEKVREGLKMIASTVVSNKIFTSDCSAILIALESFASNTSVEVSVSTRINTFAMPAVAAIST